MSVPQSWRERFDLDMDTRIRKLSAEDRKKTAVICALMHDPEVLLLDEPTRGMDSVMRNRFNDLILEEKGRERPFFCAHISLRRWSAPVTGWA